MQQLIATGSDEGKGRKGKEREGKAKARGLMVSFARQVCGDGRRKGWWLDAAGTFAAVAARTTLMTSKFSVRTASSTGVVPCDGAQEVVVAVHMRA